jgi:hypothetical protein
MPDIDESFDVVDATVDVWNEIRQDMLHDMKRRYGDAVAMREIKPVDQ